MPFDDFLGGCASSDSESDNSVGPSSSSSISAPAANAAGSEWERGRFTWTLLASQNVTAKHKSEKFVNLVQNFGHCALENCHNLLRVGESNPL